MRSLRSERESWAWAGRLGASASSASAMLRARITGNSRIVPPYGLRLPFAHLHVHLAPLAAGLDAVGRIDAEDVLRAKLVLNLVVAAIEVRGLLDVVDVAARLGAEPAQLESRVHFRGAGADADGVDGPGGAAGVAERRTDRGLRRRG